MQLDVVEFVNVQRIIICISFLAESLIISPITDVLSLLWLQAHFLLFPNKKEAKTLHNKKRLRENKPVCYAYVISNDQDK